MGSRIAVMSAGRLLQVGTPNEVYTQPATVFVAQFIGTPPMNILPPGVVGGDDVIVGIRPEHVVLTPAGDTLAHVRLVEQLGHEILVTCELVDRREDALTGATAGSTAGATAGPGDIATASTAPPGPTRRVVVRLGADHIAPALGQDVLLDFPEAHRHYFDADDGSRRA